MAKRWCAACGCLFEPRRNVAAQRCGSKRACQRTRRRRWQRAKRKADADYRANQAAARNREKQRQRNRRRRSGGSDPAPAGVAKMAAYLVGMQVLSAS